MIPGLPLWIQVFLGVIGILSFGYLVFDELHSRASNGIVYHNEADVQKAMKEIIKTQGKVCIMSRDLSWVNDEIKNLIVIKKDSILVFAQGRNDIAEKLEDEGVRIEYYGHLGFEPKTRFTVIRYNRNNPQVAIARTKNIKQKRNNFRHTIYLTESENASIQDEMLNSLATDMIALCDLVAERRKQ
jgi:hypothetical protein